MAADLPNVIDNLPGELRLNIFSFLRLKDLPMVSRVEKDWARLLNNNDDFFQDKFGLCQSGTKKVISNLSDEAREIYLNKESFNKINLSDLRSELYKILSTHGKAALDEGWITIAQACHFSPAVLTILLTRVYPSYSKVVKPNDLYKISIKHEKKNTIRSSNDARDFRFSL